MGTQLQKQNIVSEYLHEQCVSLHTRRLHPPALRSITVGPASSPPAIALFIISKHCVGLSDRPLRRTQIK